MEKSKCDGLNGVLRLKCFSCSTVQGVFFVFIPSCRELTASCTCTALSTLAHSLWFQKYTTAPFRGHISWTSNKAGPKSTVDIMATLSIAPHCDRLPQTDARAVFTLRPSIIRQHSLQPPSPRLFLFPKRKSEIRKSCLALTVAIRGAKVRRV